MNSSPQPNPEPPKRKVQRHSLDRLLRQKVVLGEITVSAEKHNGRVVVRVESPDNVRSAYYAKNQVTCPQRMATV